MVTPDPCFWYPVRDLNPCYHLERVLPGSRWCAKPLKTRGIRARSGRLLTVVSGGIGHGLVTSGTIRAMKAITITLLSLVLSSCVVAQPRLSPNESTSPNEQPVCYDSPNEVPVCNEWVP